MTLERTRIAEDLREAVRGELLFDDLARSLYSTDASIFQVEPLGIIVPIDEADVQATVRYAREHGLSVTARGAGTGMAGESLTSGLLLDFSRHFRSILEIGAETARVQAGVVYRELQEELAKVGRRFAPDTASGAQCTLGGMFANNSSGARAMKHGYTRDHLVAVRTVLADGEVVEWGREPIAAEAVLPPKKQAVVRAVADLITREREVIIGCQPRTRFNRCGYLLHDVVTDGYLDVAKLLCGSEGTLALATEITVRTIPLPADRAMAWLGFGSMEAAAAAVRDCLPAFPSSCELLDRRLLTLACGTQSPYQKLVTPATEAVLLVEFESETPGKAGRAAQRLARLFLNHPDLTTSTAALTEEDVDQLWQLRNQALPMLHAAATRAVPIPLIEDVGVPVEHLPTYLHRLQELLQKHETTASFLIHAGAGQVHTRPLLNWNDAAALRRLPALAEEVHQWALDLGGTISTQHGVGIARSPWVGVQYGRLHQVFKELKAIFDPHDLLNPGKIVTGDASALSSKLRWKPRAETVPAARLRWTPLEMLEEAQTCNGCGACRTTEPHLRMCPLFRVAHSEQASPRAKADLLRCVLDGTISFDCLASDEARAIADLCINCKMCAVECPARVQIPKLMLEAKARHAAAHGLDRTNWMLARMEEFAAFGSMFAGVINSVLSSRTLRAVLERLFGLSKRRRLPPFAGRSFLNRASRRGWTHPPSRKSGPRVAYFVDVYANYNDPELAEAVVLTLQHNHWEVFVPRHQVGCGIAPLVYGDVDSARRMAQRNIRVFGDLARAGYTILCSEPTAAVVLSQDYPELVDDPDVRRIAAQTRELSEFLWELRQEGRLRTDFTPMELTVGHHVPCHVKALQKGVHGAKLLELIPGLRAHTIDVSCSGMAGTFGMKADNLDASLKAGAPMLARMRRGDIHFGSSECSACRMQIEHGAGKRSLHPVQFLALAYRLMPELFGRLRQPIGDLVLR